MHVKQTKIVATISDRNCDVGLIRDLHKAGMNVVRLNTAHQTPEDSLRVIENVRAVSEEIGLLLDTKGPDIRTAGLAESRPVKEGEVVTLSATPSDDADLATTYEGFVDEISAGTRVLIDDGLVALLVEDKSGDCATCKVLNDGTIGNRKSINVPNAHFNLPAVTPKDKAYIEFAVEHDIDFIAHSFVRSREDVNEVQQIISATGGRNKIIAKIENQEGVDRIDEILDVAYGIMVARGDLGIEIAAHDVPVTQKRLIRKCMERAKPVITATQMLHSMIDCPRPTRAEVSDVANAIYDGTDALMLSGETAYGKYPREAVQMMTDIARSIEDEKNLMNIPPRYEEKDPGRNYLVRMAVKACRNLPIKAILIDTQTGHSALVVAAHRGKTPVYAKVHDKKLVRALSLSYGVYPSYMELPKTTDELVAKAVSSLLEKGKIQTDDTILILAGTPGQNAGANFVEINKAGLCLQTREA